MVKKVIALPVMFKLENLPFEKSEPIVGQVPPFPGILGKARGQRGAVHLIVEGVQVRPVPWDVTSRGLRVFDDRRVKRQVDVHLAESIETTGPHGEDEWTMIARADPNGLSLVKFSATDEERSCHGLHAARRGLPGVVDCDQEADSEGGVCEARVDDRSSAPCGSGFHAVNERGR